jgi:hypothetical protein
MFITNALGIMENIMDSAETLSAARLCRGAFTRNRQLSFRKILFMILKPGYEAIREKIRRLWAEFDKYEVERVSQQAFSKQRMKINHTPFEKMGRGLAEHEYSGEYELPKWNKYHVLAVDGSRMPLPNVPELREKYGTYGSEDCVTVGISALFDVKHRFILDAALLPAVFNEREAMKSHVDFLTANLPAIAENTLITADRGYASVDVFEYLTEKNINFCIRITSSWAITRGAQPGISNVKIGNSELTFAVIELKSGKYEYLVTNLKGFTVGELSELYHLRWNIETEFDVVKNKIGLAGLSGKSDNTLKQDFWAAITLANLLAVFYNQTQRKVQADRQGKNIAHEYKPNVSHVVSILKDHLISLMIETDRRKRQRVLAFIERELAREVVPIRPERSAPRKQQLCKHNKFPSNRKRV